MIKAFQVLFWRYGDIYSAYSIKEKIEGCLKKINIEKMRLNYESINIENYQ